MPLKTDYKNDVLDTSKNTKRKYQQTTNSDGTISLDDVTVYSQEGSLLGANDINATNERVNQLTAQDGLDFRFATDGEGNYGYLGADDSFIPFKNGEEPILLWTKPDGQATPLDTNLATFIPLDLLEYDAVIIEGVYGVVTSSGNYPTFCTFVRKNENGTIFAPSSVNSSSDYVAYRNVKVSSNGLTFLTGWSKNGYNATRSAMPLKVWGVRTEFEVVAPSSGNLLAELDISSGVYGNTQPHILYNHNNLISLIANGTNKWDWIFNREVNISFIEIDCIGYTSNQCNIVIDGKVYLLLPNVNGYNGTYRYYIGATIPSGYKYNVMSAFGNNSWRSTIRFYTYDDLD